MCDVYSIYGFDCYTRVWCKIFELFDVSENIYTTLCGIFKLMKCYLRDQQ